MRAGGGYRTQRSTEPLDPRYHMVNLAPEGAYDCWVLAGMRGWAVPLCGRVDQGGDLECAAPDQADAGSTVAVVVD